MTTKKKAKTFEIEGEFRYYRGFPSNRDMDGPEGSEWKEKYEGMYLTDFIMDKKNMMIVRDSGTELKIRTNADHGMDFLEDGMYLVKFKRPHKHKYANYGGPPVTVLGDGTPISEEDGFGVANGSKGFLQFTVYPTQLRNGTRWEGSQVTDWIKYPLATTAGATFENRGESRVRELDDVEDNITDEDVGRASKSKKVHDDLEDEDIPL